MDKQTRFYTYRTDGGYWHHCHFKRHWYSPLIKTTCAKPHSPTCYKPLCLTVPRRRVVCAGTWWIRYLRRCSNGIPSPTTTRYVSTMSVAKGVVSLTGQESLNGLSVVMTPGYGITQTASPVGRATAIFKVTAHCSKPAKMSSALMTPTKERQ